MKTKVDRKKFNNIMQTVRACINAGYNNPHGLELDDIEVSFALEIASRVTRGLSYGQDPDKIWDDLVHGRRF